MQFHMLFGIDPRNFPTLVSSQNAMLLVLSQLSVVLSISAMIARSPLASAGELSLSGRAENFTPVERARCPTPAAQELMDDFSLTETAVVRFYKQHNADKLDDPEFIKGIMNMSDDEIRSVCMRRYRAAPEPVGNSMRM